MIILRVGLVSYRRWSARLGVTWASFSNSRLMSADHTNLPRVVSTSTAHWAYEKSISYISEGCT